MGKVHRFRVTDRIKWIHPSAGLVNISRGQTLQAMVRGSGCIRAHCGDCVEKLLGDRQEAGY